MMIVAFDFLITITPGRCQLSESIYSPLIFFVAVSNSENGGVEITVFPDELYSGFVDNRTYFISDRRLPPECGAQYFRCQDLLVETVLPQDGGEINVLFIPLERGMAIITSPLNDLTWEWHILVVDSPDCSPTVIYKAGESLFTICINFTLQYIAVYEIQLYWNETQIIDNVIDRAVFEGPRTQLSITNLSTSNLSNFALKISSQVHKVYFAVDNTIFVMDVLDPTRTKPNLPHDQCRQIHKLTLAEKDLLLAYCSDRYLYFDLVYGDWTQIHTYSRYGIPYLCPNNNYKVTFFNHTEGDFLQFTKEGSMLNPIYNIGISSGICFEIENTTYFTWSDLQNNSVIVFDFITENYSLVSPYECSSMDCPQLLLLKDQFIVVHSDDNVYVIDALNNFNLILNVSLETPDILTFLSLALCSNNCDNNTTTTIPPYTDVTSSTTMSVKVINKSALVVSVTLVPIVIVVLVAIVLVLLIYMIAKKRWYVRVRCMLHYMNSYCQVASSPGHSQLLMLHVETCNIKS